MSDALTREEALSSSHIARQTNQPNTHNNLLTTEDKNPKHPAHTAMPPSKIVPPVHGAEVTEDVALPQQASTQPGDGKVHTSNEIPLTYKAIGVTEKLAGTVLRKPELKQHGQTILDGGFLVVDKSKSTPNDKN